MAHSRVAVRAAKTLGYAVALLAAMCAGGVRTADAQKLPAAVVGQEKRNAKLLETLDIGRGQFGRVAFTDKGRRLFVSTGAGADMTWDIARRRWVAFHTGPKRLAETPLDALPRPLSSPNAAARVTVPNSHRIVMLNRSTGGWRVFPIRHGEIKAVAFTPDSRWLLAAAFMHSGERRDEGQSTIYVVDVRSGRLAHILKAGEYRLDTLVFSHQGRLMATRNGHWFGEPSHGADVIKIWDTRLWRVRSEYATEYEVGNIQFAGDGRTLLALCYDWRHSDYYLSKYDLGGGQSGEVSVHQDSEAMRFASMELSRDGTLLVSTFEGHATAWDVATGRSLGLYDRAGKTMGANADNIALSADNRLMADIDESGIVTLWQMPPLSAWRKAMPDK